MMWLAIASRTIVSDRRDYQTMLMFSHSSAQAQIFGAQVSPTALPLTSRGALGLVQVTFLGAGGRCMLL